MERDGKNNSFSDSDGDLFLNEVFVVVDAEGDLSDEADECILLGGSDTEKEHASVVAGGLPDIVVTPPEEDGQIEDVEMLEVADDNPGLASAGVQGSQDPVTPNEGKGLEGLRPEPPVTFGAKDFRLLKDDGTYATNEEAIARGMFGPPRASEQQRVASSVLPRDSSLDRTAMDTSEAQQGKGGKKVKKRMCQACNKLVFRLRTHVYRQHLPQCMRGDISELPNVSPTPVHTLIQLLLVIVARMMVDNISHLLHTVVQRRLHPEIATTLTDKEKTQIREVHEKLGKNEKLSYDVTKPSCIGVLGHWRLLIRMIATLSPEDRQSIKDFSPDTPVFPRRSAVSGNNAVVSGGSSKGGASASAGKPSKEGGPASAGQPSKGGASALADKPTKGDKPVRQRPAIQKKRKLDQKQTEVSQPQKKAQPKKSDKPEPVVTVQLKQNSAQRSVKYGTPIPESRATRPAFIGIDTHFHPDVLMSKTGKSTVEGALAALPTSEGFRLSEAIGIFCYPRNFPDGYQRVALRKDARLSFAYGWHPKDLDGHDDEYVLEMVDTLCGTQRCVALGEVGLDYTVSKPTPSRQKKMLRELLLIARRRDLPVIIHCRDQPKSTKASDDCVDVIQDVLQRNHTIVRHCFDGDKAQFLKWQGKFPRCYFSIAGLATKGSCNPQLSLVIDRIPDNRLLIETDAPFLLPARVTGTNFNSPNLLLEVAKYVAGIRLDINISDIYSDPRAGQRLRGLLETLNANARECFRL